MARIRAESVKREVGNECKQEPSEWSGIFTFTEVHVKHDYKRAYCFGLRA